MRYNKLQAITLHTHMPAQEQLLHESEYIERNTSLQASQLALRTISFGFPITAAAADALADAPAT